MTPERPEPGRVLIVDDQPGLRLTLRGILARKGYQVQAAQDAAEALEGFEKGGFQIVLMDIKMPGMNGVEALARMRAINPSVIVILMTAYAVEDEVAQGLREGAYCVLNKPFDMERVFALMKECLGSRPLVLLVEDSAADRRTLEGILSSKSYDVAVVESGEECLKEIRERRHGAILLDVRLPGLDGVETLRRLRDIRPEVPIVVMTGAALAEEQVRELERNSAGAVLRKPLKVEELLELLERLAPERGGPS